MTCAIGAFNNGIGSNPRIFDDAERAAKICAGRLLLNPARGVAFPCHRSPRAMGPGLTDQGRKDSPGAGGVGAVVAPAGFAEGRLGAWALRPTPVVLLPEFDALMREVRVIALAVERPVMWTGPLPALSRCLPERHDLQLDPPPSLGVERELADSAGW
jgi:hypothetical protein